MQLFIDNLTVIDCSYLHPEYGVEGESWICDILLEGQLDAQSMVMDFGQVKPIIKQAIDRLTDHALLVPEQASALTSFTPHSDSVTLTWDLADGGQIFHRSPAEALCLIPAPAITIASVTDYLEQALMKLVPASVSRIEIHLREEALTTPYYHYSHGLKKHDGNCQRIAHGHRSKLDIWRDGAPAPDLVKEWCESWKHIYIGSSEDVVAGVAGQVAFAYHAPQGEFRLSLPESRCYVMDADSTVECIAQHIANCLKSRYPQSSFRVKAYEGVGKGAIATA